MSDLVKGKKEKKKKQKKQKHINFESFKNTSFENIQLTDLDFLLLVPTTAPRFTADDDGCKDAATFCGCKAGDGAPKDRDGID